MQLEELTLSHIFKHIAYHRGRHHLVLLATSLVNGSQLEPPSGLVIEIIAE